MPTPRKLISDEMLRRVAETSHLFGQDQAKLLEITIARLWSLRRAARLRGLQMALTRRGPRRERDPAALARAAAMDARGAPCPRCGLHGAHECLPASATAMAQQRREHWSDEKGDRRISSRRRSA